MPSTIDDLFPPSEREHYEKAPLVLQQVECNFRFPRVLRLEGQSPAGFQEAVRKTFPLYERGIVLALPQPIQQLPPEVLQMVVSQSRGIASHQFLAEDRKSTVTLTPETLSYSTAAYTRWEDFRHVLHEVMKAFVKEYGILFFSRIGLHYQDVIQRENLGLNDRPWNTLINPDVIGKFPFKQFEDNVQHAAHRITVKLPDGSGSVALQHGFVRVANTPVEPAYMIDFDFFDQPKIETKDAEPKFDHFHELAGRAFRWCLTKDLRDALVPKPLPGVDAVQGTGTLGLSG